MGFQVVCLSAVDGSESEQIAPLVAERLGYRLVNEEIVALAAGQADLELGLVADVERRKSMVDRILERLGTSAAASSAMGAYMATPAFDGTPDEAALRKLIRSTIEQIAEQGKIVIVAHAASYALRERRDTLRVFLTAAPETRTARLAVDTKALAKLDGNRADYLKRFYNIGAESSHDYDVVLNTDRIEPATAAAVIAGLASA